jgi:hypothetical protein
MAVLNRLFRLLQTLHDFGCSRPCMMMGVPVASTGMLGTVRESRRCFWERADACPAPAAQKTRTMPSARICNGDGADLILAELGIWKGQSKDQSV